MRKGVNIEEFAASNSTDLLLSYRYVANTELKFLEHAEINAWLLGGK